MSDVTWLWPVLVSSAITGISVGVGFAFATSRRIQDVRKDLSVLATKMDGWMDGWNVKCTLTHAPIDKELSDHKERLDHYNGRLRDIENKYGIKGIE